MDDYVTLEAGFVTWRIGSPDTAKRFFDAVAASAASDSPRLLDDLFAGEIPKEGVAAAQEELTAVEQAGAAADLETDFGKPLLPILREALDHAAQSGRPLKLIRQISRRAPFAEVAG